MKPEMEALRALGLSEYAARAYAALVALGASPAENVASAAPIPRTKVYAVLADLTRRGFVEVEAGRPRRYRARRPSECMQNERARLLATIDAGLPVLEAQYADRSRRFAGPLWLLEGVELVTQRALQMAEQAQRDVFLVASFPLPGDEKALARAFRDAVRRGVRVRVAAPSLDLPHVRAFIRAGAEVRIVALPPRVMSVDGRQALIAFPSPTGVNAVWNPSAELLALMGGVLGLVWESAQLPSEVAGT